MRVQAFGFKPEEEREEPETVLDSTGGWFNRQIEELMLRGRRVSHRPVTWVDHRWSNGTDITTYPTGHGHLHVATAQPQRPTLTWG